MPSLWFSERASEASVPYIHDQTTYCAVILQLSSPGLLCYFLNTVHTCHHWTQNQTASEVHLCVWCILPRWAVAELVDWQPLQPLWHVPMKADFVNNRRVRNFQLRSQHFFQAIFSFHNWQPTGKSLKGKKIKSVRPSQIFQPLIANWKVFPQKKKIQLLFNSLQLLTK
jgi:hypothetical protein